MTNGFIERLKLINRMSAEGKTQQEIDVALENLKQGEQLEEPMLNHVKEEHKPSIKEIYCLACRQYVEFGKYIVKKIEIKPNSYRFVLKARCPICDGICNRLLSTNKVISKGNGQHVVKNSIPHVQN